MKLPYMQNTKNKSKEYIINFFGLNYGEGTKAGEFAETENLSVSAYPVLTQRFSRAVHKALTSPTALYAKGELCYVDGTTFYYNDVAKGTVTAGAKQFAAVNTKIVIWPDRKVYDTVADTLTSIDLSYVGTAGTVSFTASSTASTIATTGPAFTFKKNDAVKITGCTSIPANNDKLPIVRSISTDGKTLTFDPLIFTAGSEAGAVTVARVAPEIDFICEYNNRLWGCKGSQIYASAAGDPFNFNVFDGLTTDSYAVPVGTNGDFTGCIGYTSHILFMKEDVCHKLYGTKPSNYEYTTNNFQGVMSGCHKSAVIINEVLYYLSRQGVVAYAGSIPYLASAAFGEKRFKNAVACDDGEKYYVSMQDESNVWGFYVYDTQKKFWIREDATHAYDIAFFEGQIYTLSADKNIYINNSGTENIAWSATLCRFDETMVETKGYSRITMRAALEAGSYINIETSANDEPFKLVKTVRATGRRVFAVPIVPTRCDNFRIRLSGKGRSKIYALTREFNTGSDIQ